MAYTTGQTTAQTAAVLTTHGMLADAAQTALATLAWDASKVGHAKIIHCPDGTDVLVKCTTGHVGGDPRFSYDASPS